MGLSLSLTGVVVVDPGPYGGRAGLRTGDILESINADEIQRPRDVETALTDPGRYVQIGLVRGGGPSLCGSGCDL